MREHELLHQLFAVIEEFGPQQQAGTHIGTELLHIAHGILGFENYPLTIEPGNSFHFAQLDVIVIRNGFGAARNQRWKESSGGTPVNAYRAGIGPVAAKLFVPAG